MPYVCTRCGGKFSSERIEGHVCVRRPFLYGLIPAAAAILGWLVLR
jgi:hypothetical protein